MSKQKYQQVTVLSDTSKECLDLAIDRLQRVQMSIVTQGDGANACYITEAIGLVRGVTLVACDQGERWD